MTLPLVSVIITNYNYAEYLTEAIQSLVAQTYGLLELIVIDDGSTDDSVTRINELQTKHHERFQRFSTHFLSVNQGINAALNVAIREVRGAVTLIFDADDILDPTHLTTLLTALLHAHKQDPLTTFAYCDCLLVTDAGQPIQRGRSKSFDPSRIETESYLPRPSPIFTSVLKKHFPLPENATDDPKHLLWKRICREGNRGLYLDKPLFSYRIHAKNASRINEKIRAACDLGLLAQPLFLSDYWPISKD